MQDSALLSEVQSLVARSLTDWTGMRQDMAEVLYPQIYGAAAANRALSASEAYV